MAAKMEAMQAQLRDEQDRNNELETEKVIYVVYIKVVSLSSYVMSCEFSYYTGSARS